jgi:two-component system, NarL family, response regulator LiaR
VRASSCGRPTSSHGGGKRLGRTALPHAPREEQERKPPALTSRELDVLRLLVAGCATIEIDRRLHLSPSTIKHHVSSTLFKLGVENRVQAAVMAVREGLVSDEPGPR